MRCVLCARRGKVTEGATHVCVNCAAWLQVQVADIGRLAADAAAYLMPGSTSGSGSRSVPGSRPPLRVEALDPELTLTGPPPAPTVLEVLESWERMIREARELTPYGPASAARAAEIVRKSPTADAHGTTSGSGSGNTLTTLVGCVSFLGTQVAWMTTEPDFPIDDFADEIKACVRALRRWDSSTEDRGTMVTCPTLRDDGECGQRLYYFDWVEIVTCKRCGYSRDAATLALIAMSDGRAVWLDPEAAARYLSISEGHLRKLAKQGAIERSHGRYLVSSIHSITKSQRHA